jgi:tryptophan 6-halogenase
MSGKIDRIVILGGGTAGWMTASYLAKAFGASVDVTVLEAPSIPRIGVGEATIPNLQTVFFDFLGLKEKDWMPECNASFKMGIKFINWCTPGRGEPHPRPTDTGTDHYYHVFGLLPELDRLPLSHYWVHDRHTSTTAETFDRSCYWETSVMDANKAPCWPDGTPATSYAWHFDANLVADFLRRFAVGTLGVRHVEGEMTEVVKDGRGLIASLRTAAGEELAGDLFVDCSGFRGLLINKAMEEPFLDMGDQLLCDSAVATAVPQGDDAGIEPFTSAIAMSSGWTWKIPMLGRFGTGYVYSSAFADRAEAAEEFCALWGLDPERTPLNHVRFRVGRNRRAWVKNCVSIGLSSCFLEPLESTGIYFISAAIYQLVRHFPDKSFDPTLLERFNAEIETMFEDTKDFIQTHFYFSPRTDTPFWRANKELVLAPDIREKIAMYRAGLPVNLPVVDVSTYYGNFEAEFRNFWTNGNYYCVFTGLGVVPDRPLPLLAHRPEAVGAAQALFADIKDKQRRMAAELPSTVDYLRSVHGRTGHAREGAKDLTCIPTPTPSTPQRPQAATASGSG